MTGVFAIPQIDEPIFVPPGKIDYRVIHQDEVWVDKQARTHVIADMPPAYAAKLVELLETVAREIATHLAILDIRVLGAMRRDPETRKLIDELAEKFPGLLDADTFGPTEYDEDPISWVTSRPLLQALRQRACAAA